MIDTREVFGVEHAVLARPNRRRFGVPEGGPFDRLCAGLVNILVGNQPDAQVLEFGLPVGEVVALEAMTIAWVSPGLGGERLCLARGERWAIPNVLACRLYLALPGGVHPAEIPRRYRGGESGPTSPLRLSPSIVPLREPILRYVPGPRADLRVLDRQCFQVAWTSDRRGLRMEGLATPHQVSGPSEPTVPLAVQLPPDGVPILLGPDGPTIGGYPVVAVVQDADREAVAQLRPGNTFRWDATTLAEAEEAKAAAEALRRRLFQQVQLFA